MSAHILVIDDDQSILELFRLILEPEGYQVTLSKSAFEDVQEVDQLRPDLIIMDFKLGRHEDGFLLLQKIKMYRPTKDIPIILCTAAVEIVVEQENVLREKGIPILYKPFDVDELLMVVERLLKNSPLSPG
jgi:two-component system response regulator HydG